MRSLIIGSVLTMFTVAAQAQYLEGVEYAVIATPQAVTTGNKVEVREVFMYACPHCFNLEPTLQKWLKTKPANAEFVRMPAVFRPTLEPHARAYYAFSALGALDKLHVPFFEAIHVHRRAVNDEASITKFVSEHGVAAEDFRRAYHSFGVDADVKQAIRLGQSYGVDSVPTLIVDGKYRTNGTMAQGSDNLMKVVDFLIKKAAAERKGATKGAKK